MLVHVQVDAESRLIAIAVGDDFLGIPLDIPETKFSEIVNSDITSYALIDNKILKQDYTPAQLKLKQEIQDIDKLQQLRNRRELECFSVINRGQLWYENLTESQKEELKDWYHAWLDVTITLTPPDAPSFI